MALINWTDIYLYKIGALTVLLFIIEVSEQEVCVWNDKTHHGITHIYKHIYKHK